MIRNWHLYRRPWTSAVAAVMSISIPTMATAQSFEDCAIVPNSLATPFVQSRTQLAILNVETSQGNPCELIEFRFAELDGDMDVQTVNDVQIRTWKETWGVNLCDQPVAYNVWYKEIGLGGMSYQVLREKYPLRTFLRRVAAAVPGGQDAAPETEAASPPVSEEPPANVDSGGVTEELSGENDPVNDSGETASAESGSGESEEDGGLLSGLGSLFSDNADAKQPDPTSDKEETPPAPAAASTAKGPGLGVATRLLTLSDPPMKGHDVCAVQRALLGRGHEITIDGVFGPGVKKAVGKFQKDAGLESSGTFDAATRQALALRAPPITSGENNDSEDSEESDE